MVEPRKPLAVLMNGAPGAGKTTLAHVLGDRLRVPVIEKDRLRAGYLRTIGTVSPGVHGPELFYKVMEHLLGCGISVVGDMALVPDQRKGRNGEARSGCRTGPGALPVVRCGGPLRIPYAR